MKRVWVVVDMESDAIRHSSWTLAHSEKVVEPKRTTEHRSMKVRTIIVHQQHQNAIKQIIRNRSLS